MSSSDTAMTVAAFNNLLVFKQLHLRQLEIGTSTICVALDIKTRRIINNIFDSSSEKQYLFAAGEIIQPMIIMKLGLDLMELLMSVDILNEASPV